MDEASYDDSSYENAPQQGIGTELADIGTGQYDTLKHGVGDPHIYSTAGESGDKASTDRSNGKIVLSTKSFVLTLIGILLFCTVLCIISGAVVHHLLNGETRDTGRQTSSQDLQLTSGNNTVDDLATEMEVLKAQLNQSRDSQADLAQQLAGVGKTLQEVQATVQAMVQKQNWPNMTSGDGHADINAKLATLNNTLRGVKVTTEALDDIVQTVQDNQKYSDSASRGNHTDIYHRLDTLDNVVQAIEDKQRSAETASRGNHSDIYQRLGALDSVVLAVQEQHSASDIASRGNHTDIYQKLGSVDNTLQALTAAVQTVQERQSSSDITSTDISQRLDTLGNVVQSVQLKQNNTDQQVAFTAGYTTKSLADGVLTFDNVTLNAGDGYNKATGRFRCPVAGTYLFSVTLISMYARRDRIYCWVRKNAANLAIVYNQEGANESVSMSVFVRLSVGDFVDLGSCYNVNDIIGGHYTLFVGSLIQAD